MQSTQWKDSVYSDGSSLFLKPTTPRLGENVTIKIRGFKESPIQKILLRIAPDGEEYLLPMKVDKTDSIFRRWKIKADVTTTFFNYRFKILTENQIYWYNQEGLQKFTPDDSADFKIIADYQPPTWLRDSVFYQIFPDRFNDGNPENNVKDDEYTYLGHPTRAKQWGEKPKPWKHSRSLTFFGGDLAGIKEKIGYLKELGVNALYLNPIFKSPSNHKYDTADYFQIDPHFGTNEEFAELVEELHQHGMRIVLDGVFNHTGINCQWFKDAMKHRESDYFDFYIFEEHPEKYLSWKGTKILPVLDYRSKKVREMIYAGENSVAKYWLKPPYSIDGWRLDVANMLARQGKTQIHREVWREFRQAVKETTPDAYIMGENFFDPTEYLQGDMFDGVMNYPGFNHPVRRWFSGKDFRDAAGAIDAETLYAQVRRFMSKIGWQIALNRFNFLSCHDLPRFNYIVTDKRQLSLGAILLFTFPGVPCIYYGEEIGLNSTRKDVESSRNCMIWDESKWNMDVRHLYKTLAMLRIPNKALRDGSFQNVYARGDILSFARFTARQLYLIVLNNGEAKMHVDLPVRIVGLEEGDVLRDELTAREFKVSAKGLELNLEDYEGMILKGIK